MIDIEKKTSNAELQQVTNIELPDFVWIPNFISIAGSVIYGTDRKPNDIDIIIRSDEQDNKYNITLDKSLRLKIDRILESEFGKMSDNWLDIQWIANTYGPNWKYMPIYDLVLRARKPELVEVGEDGFAEKFYKGLQDKDVKILIDNKLNDPTRHKLQLIGDLRYLSIGYQKIEDGELWGDWKKIELLKYFAKIVDALREIGIELVVPLMGDKAFNTPYWRCYREARKYLKEPEVVEIEKPVEKQIRKVFVSKENRDQQIVSGVIYAPDELDSQQDMSTAEEIQKASYGFMENSQIIKIYHDGKQIKAKILESFISPTDYSVEDISGSRQYIKKGSWIMTVKIYGKEVWNKIKEGELLGFSMAGRATIV
jgi:hypothetical protein